MANVNAVEEDDGIADDGLLHSAITSQNVPLVLRLLDKGASPDALDSLGYAPLHLAAIKEDAQITTCCLNLARIRQGIMLFLTLREATPLLFVAESRSALVVAELSHGGCDVNLSNNCHFESLLSTAVKYGHYDIANLLLKNGANVDGDCRATLSPLFQAVVQHRGDLVEQLYPQGADINLLDADGDTAICQAAYQGDMDICQTSS